MLENPGLYNPHTSTIQWEDQIAWLMLVCTVCWQHSLPCTGYTDSRAAAEAISFGRTLASVNTHRHTKDVVKTVTMPPVHC